MSGNISCADINIGFTHAFLPPVFAAVFVVGTAANVWGLRSVCRSWRSIGSINVFMLNLGVADLLYLSTLPFLFHYYFHDSRWTFGQTFCKVTRFCFNLNLYGSIGFLTCISVYRYLGIVHPMRVMGKIHIRHSVTLALLVWVLVFIQILPDMFFDKNDETNPNKTEACFDTTSDRQVDRYQPYSLGWAMTGFAVPLVVILACYGHVVYVLATKANINPLLKQRCLKLVVILVILFSVCFIPYHLFRNINLETRILKQEGVCYPSFRWIYIAHQVGRCLACLNSALNPLIYIVGNDEFLLKLHHVGQRVRVSVVSWRYAVQYRKPPLVDESPIRTPAKANDTKD